MFQNPNLAIEGERDVGVQWSPSMLYFKYLNDEQLHSPSFECPTFFNSSTIGQAISTPYGLSDPL